MVPLALWDGNDSAGLWWPWWDMGIPRTSMAPLGLWDGKDSGTVVVLVGGSPKDFPWSYWDFGRS